MTYEFTTMPAPSPIVYEHSPILFVRRAFGKTRQWEELAGLAKSKKSAIGFGPFVDVCIEAGVPAEANRYTEQCCGSMTFWCGSGSGSADPCLRLMDPPIFLMDLQEVNIKLILKKGFCLLLFEGTFTNFSKIKSQKE
jgi:hypothetical protein